MIPDRPQKGTEVMVLFRIITRREWEELQGWHRSCPGSTVEHPYAGLYVLTIPASSVGMAA